MDPSVNLQDEIKSWTTLSEKEVDQWLASKINMFAEVAKKNKTPISREAFYLLKKEGKLHFQCPTRRQEYAIEVQEQLEEESFSQLFYWKKLRAISKELTYLTVLIYILLAGILLTSNPGSDFVLSLICCSIIAFSHYIVVSKVSMRVTRLGVRTSAFGPPSLLSKLFRKLKGDDSASETATFP